MAKKKRSARGRPRSRARVVMSLEEAKKRLDTLIGKSKDILHKPIGVAEVLYRARTEGLAIDDAENYRRKSDKWSKQVVREIRGYASTSNSRYWDQMYDAKHISPPALAALREANEADQDIPVVEAYVYATLTYRLQAIKEIMEWVSEQKPVEFRLEKLIKKFFGDTRLKKSIDKLYEVVVHALFKAIVRRIDVRASLTVDPGSTTLQKFDDFALAVLGVNSAMPSLESDPSLYRVGRANASDGGLDMWANFGPAVQVKHVSLRKREGFEDICSRIHADRIIIVCKDADATVIDTVLAEAGLGDRIQGIVTESLLCEWYDRVCSFVDEPTMAADLITELVEAIDEEFSVAKTDTFVNSRGYQFDALPEEWQVTDMDGDTPDEEDE